MSTKTQSTGNSQMEDTLSGLSRFAQVELRHQQIIEHLEAAAEEERQIIKKAVEARRRTLIPFGGVVRRLEQERSEAETKLEELNQRIAEETGKIMANRSSIHSVMHAWLTECDEEYRKSSDIEDLRQDINDDIRPLVGLLVDMLARYGATRNEIAVSYNSTTQTLSAVALAALDRLIHSYDMLMETQNRFADRIECLNSLALGSMFEALQLYRFEQVVPPDCRHGMDYPVLRANFEAGASKLRTAVEELNDYVGPIEATPEIMGNILHNYRDERWKQYLAELNPHE